MKPWANISNRMKQPQSFRSIWISDIHLGTRGAQAEHLLDFLKNTRSEFLYLVGDVFDGWRLSKNWQWPQAHNDVIQKLLRKARKGTSVFYVPGNHDAFARAYDGMQFGGITVHRQLVHINADKRRFLIFHGDEFDVSIRYAKWLAHLGSWAYEMLIYVNRVVHAVRNRLGFRYWSFAGYMKQKVKKAVQYVDDFEISMTDFARKEGYDGVICGHIHRAEMRNVEGILYCNDGDWVENCTALVEHHDGRMEIIDWVRGNPIQEPDRGQAVSERIAA